MIFYEKGSKAYAMKLLCFWYFAKFDILKQKIITLKMAIQPGACIGPVSCQKECIGKAHEDLRKSRSRFAT